MGILYQCDRCAKTTTDLDPKRARRYKIGWRPESEWPWLCADCYNGAAEVFEDAATRFLTGTKDHSPDVQKALECLVRAREICRSPTRVHTYIIGAIKALEGASDDR